MATAVAGWAAGSAAVATAAARAVVATAEVAREACDESIKRRTKHA